SIESAARRSRGVMAGADTGFDCEKTGMAMVRRRKTRALERDISDPSLSRFQPALRPRNSEGVSNRRFFRTLSGTQTGCLVEKEDNSASARGKTDPHERSADLADGARVVRTRVPRARSASEAARCGQSRGGGDVRTWRGQRRHAGRISI